MDQPGHMQTNLAPGGRLVTAGDGNMVSVGHIGHPRQAPPGARKQPRRIAVPVQEERPYPMSARTPQAEPLLTPAEVATMFRVDPKTETREAKAARLTSMRALAADRRYREAEVRALRAGTPQPRPE